MDLLKTIFLSLICCFHLSLLGQELNISIDQIHELKDLSVDTHIKCLAKDSVGNLWVGADNGLYRYNGQQLDRIDIPFIKDIILTTEGQLMVLSDNGLFGISTTLHNWEIKHIIQSNKAITDTSLTYPKTIYQDIEGALWIAENEYIVRYQNEQLKRFQVVNQKVGNYLRHSFTFAEDGFGTLWVMFFNGLLYRYGRMEDNFIKVPLPIELNEASELISNGADKLWIGTYSGIFEIIIDYY